jgi:hypothetical protein
VYADAWPLPYQLSTSCFINSSDLTFWLDRVPASTSEKVLYVELGRSKRIIVQLPALKGFCVKLDGRCIRLARHPHSTIVYEETPAVFEELKEEVGETRSEVEIECEVLPKNELWREYYQGEKQN